jgi:hypothetical protein
MVNLNPMTYRDMIEYDNNKSSDKLTQLKVDIELLKKDTPNIGELNYFDFESVLMMKKLISVTSVPSVKLERTCTCGNLDIITVNIDELRYTDFDPDIAGSMSSVKIGNKVIGLKVPKLNDVEELLTLLQMTRSDVDFEIFQTLSIVDFGSRPNEVIYAINNATHGDILLLEYLKHAFIGGSKEFDHTCTKCGRKESVTINSMVTGMFRLLQFNEKIDKNKITLSK